MDTAFLIVDLQNDYFPGGRAELEGSLRAGETAGRVLAHFRRQNLPVVFIQHIAVRPGATFFLPDTAGAEIHPSVQPLPSETVLQKHFPNSFRETGLLAHLQGLGVKRLVVSGMMTHMCLDAAVRAATDLGFECWTVGDACATRSLKLGNHSVAAADVHAAFLAALNGSYGKVLDAETVLGETL